MISNRFRLDCHSGIFTLPVLDSVPLFSFSSWPRFQPKQDDCHDVMLSHHLLMSHPENGGVEDDDGREAVIVHPELTSEVALALRVVGVLAGDSGQVQRRQGGGVHPLQGSNNVPRHRVQGIEFVSEN